MTDPARPHRLATRRRDGEQVTALELFFDLVFVLAITQCTALMGAEESWASLAKGLLVLAILWWSWVGYAWLTTAIDPDSGLARLVVFLAMAGILVVALCVPRAFGDLALTLAVAYGVVRAAHIALLAIASAGDPRLRRSVTGLGISTAAGVGLLVAAAFTDGTAQAALWIVALVLDVGEPFLFGSDGWQVEPHHFVERHGLIVIIALGESVVALGVGAQIGLTGGVIAASVVGVAVAAALWWSYFDVGSILAGRRLAEVPAGREQNEMARDGYSYLHYPIVAGVVLFALGAEHTLAHLGEPLPTVPAAALAGGLALFLAGQVAFKLRVLGALSRARLAAIAALLLLVPVLTLVDAWLGLVLAGAVVWALVAYESVRAAEVRAGLHGAG